MTHQLLPLAATGDLPKQKLFVAVYTGDENFDWEALGITTRQAHLWEKQEWFRDALAKRLDRETAPIRRQNIYQLGEAIAKRDEILALWSDTMTNTTLSVKERLKASELLAKSQGILMEKVVHEGNADKPIVIQKMDLDERLKLLLPKPIDAEICIPSQPLEISHDDWLDDAPECPATVTPPVP